MLWGGVAMFELRAYRNSDLALMPPRACEREAAVIERELAYINQQRLANPSFTLWGGHFKTEPIAAAGIIIFQPGIGEAWFRGSTRVEADKLAAVWCGLTVKRHFRALVKKHKLRVVQMLVETEDPATPGPWLPWLESRPTETVKLKFARWLGFEIEGLMRNRGPNGENYYMMSYLSRDNGRPQAPARKPLSAGVTPAEARTR